MRGAVEFGWHGLRVVLLPDRAVWLPDDRTLLIADVHLGKAASFRARGVPVPEGVTQRDLNRVSTHLERTGAERLIVLGDLIHDDAALRARTREAVVAWRGGWAGVSVDLVVGNHDRRVESCEPLGVRVLGPGVRLEGNSGACIDLTHEPPAGAAARPTFCGHLHPVVSVGGARTAARVRTACFWFDGMTAILPAFGSFTGGRSMAMRGDEQVFAAGDLAVIPVTRGARDRCKGLDAGAYDRA